jgi:hypothetical protein
MGTATCAAPPCEACPSTRCHGPAFGTAFLLAFWSVKKPDKAEAARGAAGDGPAQPLTEASGEPALEDPPTELPRSAAIAEPEHPGIVVRFSPTLVDQLLDWSGPSEIKVEKTSPARMDNARPADPNPPPLPRRGPGPRGNVPGQRPPTPRTPRQHPPAPDPLLSRPCPGAPPPPLPTPAAPSWSPEGGARGTEPKTLGSTRRAKSRSNGKRSTPRNAGGASATATSPNTPGAPSPTAPASQPTSTTEYRSASGTAIPSTSPTSRRSATSTTHRRQLGKCSVGPELRVGASRS